MAVTPSRLWAWAWGEFWLFAAAALGSSLSRSGSLLSAWTLVLFFFVAVACRNGAVTVSAQRGAEHRSVSHGAFGAVLFPSPLIFLRPAGLPLGRCHCCTVTHPSLGHAPRAAADAAASPVSRGMSSQLPVMSCLCQWQCRSVAIPRGDPDLSVERKGARTFELPRQC